MHCHVHLALFDHVLQTALNFPKKHDKNDDLQYSFELLNQLSLYILKMKRNAISNALCKFSECVIQSGLDYFDINM